MEEAIAQALKTIATSAPMALVMLAAIVVLWRANAAERERHAGEEKALQDKLVDILTKIHGAMKGD